MKRWGRVVQVICLVLGIVLTGFAACCAVDSLRIEREFKAAQVARPVSVEVDFSKPGEVTAPLHQTYCASHDEMLCLELAPQPQQGQPTAELLDGLQGTYATRNEAGEEICSGSLRIISQSWERTAAQGLTLAYFDRFDKGRYVLTVRIEQGAAALSGFRQTLVVRYCMCGIEILPARLAQFVAFVTGIPGLLLLGVTIVKAVRRRAAVIP